MVTFHGERSWLDVKWLPSVLVKQLLQKHMVHHLFAQSVLYYLLVLFRHHKFQLVLKTRIAVQNVETKICITWIQGTYCTLKPTEDSSVEFVKEFSNFMLTLS